MSQKKIEWQTGGPKHTIPPEARLYFETEAGAATVILREDCIVVEGPGGETRIPLNSSLQDRDLRKK